MKPIVLFKCGDVHPTPWDDVSNAWNKDMDNHGYWYSMKDAEEYIYQYKRDRTNLVFAKSKDPKKQFVIIKDFIGENNPGFKDSSREVDMKFIIDWLNTHKGDSLGFGTFLNHIPGNAQPDIMKHAIYYARDPFPGGRVKNARNDKFISDEDNDEELQVVTFFYAYKLTNQPIYFIIFNPNLISLAGNVEFVSERGIYRVIDEHYGEFANQLLTPKMSKNAFPLDMHWYVVNGDEFDMDVGKLSAITDAYGISVQHVKVMSDLSTEHIEGNKYKVRFKKGQTHGYISLRLDTGTTFDFSLIGSKNRLIYNIRIDKKFKEE